MRLFGELSLLSVAAQFRKDLHETLLQTLVEASKAYLNATVISIIPVWSGASRATFSPLASQVQFALAITPVASAPNRIALGVEHGTVAYAAGPTEYSFEYSTTLPHLLVNEYYNANEFRDEHGNPYFHLIHPGPYHFQEAGAKAFADVVSRLVVAGTPYEAVKLIVG